MYCKINIFSLSLVVDIFMSGSHNVHEYVKERPNRLYEWKIYESDNETRMKSITVVTSREWNSG